MPLTSTGRAELLEKEEDVNEFIKSSGGRLLALAVGFLLMAGGAAALLGEPGATWISALAFPVAIALSVVSLAIGSSEYMKSAAFLAITLPFVLFVYSLALGLIVQLAPVAGGLLVVLGAGALAFSLRPSGVAAAKAVAPSSAEPALR